MARLARALRGEQIQSIRVAVGFDGTNEGKAVGVPAAGVWHRDSQRSPPPNKRLQLTKRARPAARLA